MEIKLTIEEVLAWPYVISKSGHAQVNFLGRGISRSHLVILIATGKVLKPKKEIVHHINENKLDDRLENLMVMTRSDHMKHHNFLQPWIGIGWPKGKPRSKETREKISAAHQGMEKPWLREDKERNRKISEFRKGYRYSDEAKQKISEGVKRHNAAKKAAQKQRVSDGVSEPTLSKWLN
jgi:hypothetical protein